MNENMQTMGQSFASMIPSMVAMLVFGYLWLLVCRWIKRVEDAVFSKRMEAVDVEQRWVLLRYGTPSDRLFIGSMMLAGIVGVAMLIVNAVLFTCLFASACGQ